jgi:hypothetical protein
MDYPKLLPCSTHRRISQAPLHHLRRLPVECIAHLLPQNRKILDFMTIIQLELRGRGSLTLLVQVLARYTLSGNATHTRTHRQILDFMTIRHLMVQINIILLHHHPLQVLRAQLSLSALQPTVGAPLSHLHLHPPVHLLSILGRGTEGRLVDMEC